MITVEQKYFGLPWDIKLNYPKSRPDTSLKVGPHVFTVAWDAVDLKHEDGGILYGRMDLETLTISVAQGLASTMERETLLHEVIHACNDLTVTSEADNETATQCLGVMLLGVIRDNEWFAGYLRG